MIIKLSFGILKLNKVIGFLSVLGNHPRVLYFKKRTLASL